MAKKTSKPSKKKFQSTILFDPPICRVNRLKGKPGSVGCKVLSDKEIAKFKRSFAWRQWQEDKAIYDAHKNEDRQLGEESIRNGNGDRELRIA